MTLATRRESRLMVRCATKRRFWTLGEAVQARRGVLANDLRRQMPEQAEGLQVYACPFCGQFHLGHRKTQP